MGRGYCHVHIFFISNLGWWVDFLRKRVIQITQFCREVGNYTRNTLQITLSLLFFIFNWNLFIYFDRLCFRSLNLLLWWWFKLHCEHSWVKLSLIASIILHAQVWVSIDMVIMIQKFTLYLLNYFYIKGKYTEKFRMCH